MNQDEILEAGKRVKAILPTINKPALAMLIAKVADMDFGTVEEMLSPLYVEPIKVGDKRVSLLTGSAYTIIAEFDYNGLHYFVGKIGENSSLFSMTEDDWNRMSDFYVPAKQTTTAAKLLAHLTRQGVSNG